MRLGLPLVVLLSAGCATASSHAASCPEPPPVAPVPEAREGFEVQPGQGLSASALAAFRETAKAERSTALLVSVDGTLVVEEYAGVEPVASTVAMSVTKSVVALAIGMLVDEGQLELDEPLSQTVLPEWKDTDKAGITLRGLMTHVTGLDPNRYGQVDGGWDGTRSIEANGLASEIRGAPGQFAYNNNMVDFLSVVAQRAHPEGLFVDDQLDATLFAKLGVTGAYWLKDPHGQPRAAGELFMRPIDLLKIGQLVLQRGRWNGEVVISESFMDAMVAPLGRPQGPPMFYGLLWWLHGDDQILAYHADGYLGQHIVVVPRAKLVAVRTRDPRVVGDDPAQFGWRDFVWDVLQLAGYPISSERRQAFMRDSE